MSRILFITEEPLSSGDRMAGLQARIYEMAMALSARGHHIVIAEHGRHQEEWIGQDIQFIGIESITHVPRMDVWIAHPLLVGRYIDLLRNTPLVLDGYEVPFGSYLAHAAYLMPQLGNRVMYEYRNTMMAFLKALSKADRVLCANERQRALYLTALGVLGRINPTSFVDELVLTVQSGAPELTTTTFPESWGIRSRDKVVLWAGGCYPWFDVETYLGAMPLILDAEPETQFLFVGLGGNHHPGNEPFSHPAANTLAAGIKNDPRLDKASVIVDWLPYNERGQAFAASTVGVCTYGDHIETLFSMRTRVLEMVGGGLPVVATRGDSLSEYLERNGAGITVPALDKVQLASAISGILRDRHRRHDMATKARTLAQTTLSWAQQIEPLHRFCLNPTVDAARFDPLVKRTAARIVEINDGLVWKLKQVFQRFGAAVSRRSLSRHV